MTARVATAMCIVVVVAVIGGVIGARTGSGWAADHGMPGYVSATESGYEEASAGWKRAVAAAAALGGAAFGAGAAALLARRDGHGVLRSVSLAAGTGPALGLLVGLAYIGFQQFGAGSN